MNLYISHSHSDNHECRKLKRLLEEEGFSVVSKRGPLEFYSALTMSGKAHIQSADLCIVLFTSNGRSCYPVHQELGYMTTIAKDHFIMENNGKTIDVKEVTFERSALEKHTEISTVQRERVKQILRSFAGEMFTKEFNFIVQTNDEF